MVPQHSKKLLKEEIDDEGFFVGLDVVGCEVVGVEVVGDFDGDDEGFSQLLWEALDVEDEFVDHLERQLKTNTDHLTSKPKRKFSRNSL